MTGFFGNNLLSLTESGKWFTYLTGARWFSNMVNCGLPTLGGAVCLVVPDRSKVHPRPKVAIPSLG